MISSLISVCLRIQRLQGHRLLIRNHTFGGLPFNITRQIDAHNRPSWLLSSGNLLQYLPSTAFVHSTRYAPGPSIRFNTHVALQSTCHLSPSVDGGKAPTNDQLLSLRYNACGLAHLHHILIAPVCEVLWLLRWRN